MNDFTELLTQVRSGDGVARDALFALAYDELRRLAQARLRASGPSMTLNATALVHETYLRFVGSGELRAEDRRAFFAFASQVMRSVIVNRVRDRLALKRGGDYVPVTLSTDMAAGMPADEENILRVHEALDVLGKAEPRLAEVAEMRYFGGYSQREIAETFDVTERTVQRDWEKARLLLLAALS